MSHLMVRNSKSSPIKISYKANHLKKKSLSFSYKTKDTLTILFSNHTPWYLPKRVENVCPPKTLHVAVYRSFILNCQSLKASKLPELERCVLVDECINNLWYIQKCKIFQCFKKMSYQAMKIKEKP